MGEDVQKMEALLVSPKGAAWRRAQFLCSISAKVPDNFADKQLLRILLAKKSAGRKVYWRQNRAWFEAIILLVPLLLTGLTNL
jgi:hypothetical protein